MIDIKKSYRLSRVHLVISLIVVLILMGFMLRFFDMIQASIEQVSVDINLLNMQQMIHFQDLLTHSKNSQCKILDNPDLFQQISPSSDSSESKSTPGTWQYDSQKHQITYNVRSTSYFRSKTNQKIVVDLYCKEGVVVFKEQSYHWCHDKKVWGCSAW
jgi:hypothetical protein